MLLTGKDMQVISTQSPYVRQPCASKSSKNKYSQFFREEGRVGGLLRNVAKCFKLANFWTQCLTGAATESSQKISLAGSLLGNYIGICELPKYIEEIQKNFHHFEGKSLQGTAELASAIFGAGKSFSNGVELLGTRFGLLSSKAVHFFTPLNPLGTFVYGANEAVFKNIPSLQTHWKEDSKKAFSSLLKLVKHVALTAIGIFGLIASFFRPVCALWVISSLSTVSVISSISAHFFDALVLPPKKEGLC